MNFKKWINICFFILSGSLILSSCDNTDVLGDEDDITKLEGNKRVNNWIHTTMKSYYYWLGEIKDFNSYQTDTNPEQFFASLISSKEKKTDSNGKEYFYSYITDNNTTKSIHENENSYGIEFVDRKRVV